MASTMKSVLLHPPSKSTKTLIDTLAIAVEYCTRVDSKIGENDAEILANSFYHLLRGRCSTGATDSPVSCSGIEPARNTIRRNLECHNFMPRRGRWHWSPGLYVSIR